MAKILIVEDERDIAKVLATRLMAKGFNVVIAVDAYQGSAASIHDKPDLIILDLMLPAGGGLKVLQNIRGSLKSATIPVIILTGIKDPDYQKKVREQGIQGYFEKPYDFDELLSAINGLIGTKS